jgi:hypothetical protein
MGILQLILAVAVLLIAWVLVERFSPDATIAYICKIVIFVFALILILKLLLPLIGVGFSL